MDKKQNKIQRGFSAKSSSSNTCLVMEAISEVKDNKQPLFLQYLNVKKAFDVVWHARLLCSLYQQGVAGPVWKLNNDLYKNISSSVMWQGKLCNALQDYLGLRQGGDTSADTFKNKTNSVLNELEVSFEGYNIGDIPVATQTYSDDTTLIASTLTSANILLSIAERDSNNQRYTFSSTKSRVMVANPKNTATTLYGEEMVTSEMEIHLSLQRVPDERSSPTIEHISRLHGYVCTTWQE